MYTLLLTHGERKAIDWVGHRYGNGDDLYRVLWTKCLAEPEDADWDEPVDITFTIPESAAWAINEIREAENGWPCFADALRDKLDEFCAEIV